MVEKTEAGLFLLAHRTSAEGTADDGGEDNQLMTETDVVDPATVEYQAGNYSPQLIRPSDLPPDTIVFDAADDIKRLEFARHQILVTGQLQVSLCNLTSEHSVGHKIFC